MGDEIGVPTYTPDLAEAIVELLAEDALAAAPARTAVHHLVNGGRASRADWAREVLRATRIDVEVVDVPGSTWQRASTPPRWAVLEPTPLPSGEPMRDWREAFAHAVPALVRVAHRGLTATRCPDAPAASHAHHTDRTRPTAPHGAGPKGPRRP